MKDKNMRLVVDKAAEVILTYVLSDEFSWDRDQEILRQIVDCGVKLKAILDAREFAPITVPSPMVQDD